MSNMNLAVEQVHNLIKSRRTCYQFLDKDQYPVDPEKLKICLDAAIYSPNHKLTQPWFFWVIGEQYKSKLSYIYADNRTKKKFDPKNDNYQCLYDKAIEKFSLIPKVILVGQHLSEDPVIEKEDYAACSCAIQNFQLMAWQQNIGVQWSTGPIINDPRTYELMEIDQKKTQIIGALYLGNIDEKCTPKSQANRKPYEEVTLFTD